MLSVHKCNTTELEAIIQSTPKGGNCRLETKDYYLTKRIVIHHKKNITIDCNGAVFRTRYVNTEPACASTDAILFKDCEHVTLKNLTLTTDTPVNVAATVESFDEDELSFIIKVDDCYPMNGKEVLMGFDSMDADGSPDHQFECYVRNPDSTVTTVVQKEIICLSSHVGAANEYLGKNRFKIFLANLKYLQNPVLKPGMRLCIRHTVYGPSAITLINSNDTILQDITMPAVPGFGITVLTRCHNLTIDGLRMPIIDRAHTLMACNCDGIHIVGLTGRLILQNCLFNGLGDDALNVHSAAGTVTEINTKKHLIKCNYCKKNPDGTLPKKWCLPGEILRFFDPITQKVTATAIVTSFKDGILCYRNLSGEIWPGYMIQNTAFTPSCIISNCEVRNSRARGFLIQTENVEIKDCSFYGTSNSAVKAAPAFIKWHEVGPCHHLYVHNNTFVKCGFLSPEFPAVAVYTRHSGNDDAITDLHSDIRIEENAFKQADGICIGISSADNVTVSRNQFIERQNTNYPAIQIVSCKDVNISNNEG